MRRVLDPMFVYFDTRQHWAPQNGLAMVVLSRMAYFIENTGIVLPLLLYKLLCSGCIVSYHSYSMFYLRNCMEFRTLKHL